MLHSLLRSVAPFSMLWSLSTYLYLLALSHISASDTSAILCCSQAFAFLLSWIGLRDTFMGVRIVGTILSITGIVMMAYADSFHSDSITGVALEVGSACTSALFKVLLRSRIGEGQPGPMSTLLSCVGLCSGCMHSWLCVLLYCTRVEYWPPTQAMPWGVLCLQGLLLFSFNVMVNLGSVLTYPGLILLGVLMTVPVNTAAEFYLTEQPQLSQVRVAVASTIGLDYILLLFPEHWHECFLQWLGGLWLGGWREKGVSREEVPSAADPRAASRTKPKSVGVAASEQAAREGWCGVRDQS